MKRIVDGLQLYECARCEYKTFKKSNYKRHMETKRHNYYKREKECVCGNKYKHISNVYRHRINCKQWNKMLELKEDEKKNECICGKRYKYKSGLSKHRNICEEYIKKERKEITMEELDTHIETIINEKIHKSQEIAETKEVNEGMLDTITDKITSTVISVIKETNETIKNTMEEVKEIAIRPQTINNTQINNTQINIVKYLNTECKDAMNLSDFIKNIIFTITDLEELSKRGIIHSINNTLYKELSKMEKTKRPLHCTDSKRNSFYVKEKNNWQRDKNNEIIKTSIKNMPRIHNKSLNEWKRYNTDWLDIDEKQDFLNNTIISSTDIYNERIINKIVKGLTEYTIR